MLRNKISPLKINDKIEDTEDFKSNGLTPDIESITSNSFNRFSESLIHKHSEDYLLQTSFLSPFKRNEPIYGVSMKFLNIIKDIIRGNELTKMFTTREVVERIIKPWTSVSHKSLIEDLKRSYRTKEHPALKILGNDKEHISTANVYVCHAWDSNFLEMVGALDDFTNRKQYENKRTKGLNSSLERKVYFWIDIFSLTQWKTLEEQNFDLTSISNLIELVQETCVVMLPWYDPLPLKRIWCLFELYVSKKKDVKITIQLSKDRHHNFTELLINDYQNALDALNLDVCIENSKASLSGDHKKLIDYFLTWNNSLHDVNDSVFDAIINSLALKTIKYIKENITKNDEVLPATSTFEPEHKSVRSKRNGFFDLFRMAFNCSNIDPEFDIIPNDPDPQIQKKQADNVNLKLTLATLLHGQKNYDESERVFLETIQESKSLYGDDHPTTLSILGNLALLYKDQKKYSDSENLYLEILRRKRANLGSRHPSTIMSIQNLGNLMYFMNKPDEAIRYYELAKSEHEKNESQRSFPDYMKCIEKLAYVYSDMEMNKEAMVYYSRLLRMKIDFFGSSHKETMDLYDVLGAFYLKENQLDLAEDMYSKAFEIRKGLYGYNSISTIENIYKLAIIQQQKGEFHVAEENIVMVLRYYEDIYGPLNDKTIELGDRLIELLISTNQFTKAEIKLISISEDKENLYGAQSDKLISVFAQLGSVYTSMKKHDLAGLYFEKALNLIQRNELEDELEYIQIIVQCARSLDQLEKHDQSIRLYEKATQKLESLQGPSSELYLEASESLVYAYKSAGYKDEMMKLLKSLLSQFEDKFGKNHDKSIELNMLLYESRHSNDAKFET